MVSSTLKFRCNDRDMNFKQWEKSVMEIWYNVSLILIIQLWIGIIDLKLFYYKNFCRYTYCKYIWLINILKIMFKNLYTNTKKF